MRTACIVPNLLVVFGILSSHASSAAAADEFQDKAPSTEEGFSLHGQFTYVVQADDGFHAPYSGPNSLSPARNEETVDATLLTGFDSRSRMALLDETIYGSKVRPTPQIRSLPDFGDGMSHRS